MYALLLALCLDGSTDTHRMIVVDVDVIELNHILTGVEHEEAPWKTRVEVRPQSHFWIFWSLHGDDYRVRDWCQYLPVHQLTHSDGWHYLRLVGANGSTYVIRGRAVRETWTFYDREREDARYLSTEKRKRIEGLRR